MEEDEIDRYNHVMYFSKSHINQFFTENVSESDKISISKSEDSGSSIEIGIDTFAKLNAEFSGEVGSEEIHQINFNDSFLQVKKSMNLLDESDQVYPVSSLKEKKASPSGLYYFDCPLQLIPTESPFDDKNYIEVIGKHGGVEFSGTTSVGNWGSRSHAVTATKTEDPYPFKGVLKPIKLKREGIESITFSVQFLYILAPDIEESQRWREYQDLLKKHPGFEDGQ
ncbi:hypothetical protein [Natronomonas amylolytica]|uniref:hypothetical protein n=1 Tax=Natronomonas amylolytica TaxID=3108498 RepID=UPI003009853B